jgi:hypothetical protein
MERYLGQNQVLLWGAYQESEPRHQNNEPKESPQPSETKRYPPHEIENKCPNEPTAA